jgi:AmiR/NasT family two-component response regulator
MLMMPSDRGSAERLEADAVDREAQIAGLEAEAILRDERITELVAEVDSLHRAMEHRAVIEQAKGVIMSTMGCGPDAAFAVLVAQSQTENRKLWEIATELADAQDHHDD